MPSGADERFARKPCFSGSLCSTMNLGTKREENGLGAFPCGFTQWHSPKSSGLQQGAHWTQGLIKQNMMKVINMPNMAMKNLAIRVFFMTFIFPKVSKIK
jgi:hypothetical protein